jgi:hypothetical protein
VSAVLRIALTYFSLAPLQKWLSIAGVALVTGALLLPGPPLAIAAVLGTVLVVFVPLLLGGASMRYGSRPSVLQLRPGAHWKMLAAALLTVCVMMGLGLIAVWILSRAGLGQRGTGAAVAPAQLALAAWGIASICWVCSFAASASRFLRVVLFVGFVAISYRQWELLRALHSPPLVLASVGAACWLAFALWYLRTNQVGRPGWGAYTAALLGFGANVPGDRISPLLDARGQSRAVATRAYLLGTASLAGFALPGLVMSAVALLLIRFPHAANAPGSFPLPVVFLNLFSWLAAALAAMATRRARLLWLRAGMDRASLFLLAERTTLQAAGLMMLGGTFVLTGYSIAMRPDLAPQTAVYVATQLSCALALFYSGLSLTRGWTAGRIAVAIALGLGWIAQMILLPPHSRGTSPVIAPAILGIAVLLALLLRQHARKRWHSLDWHLTRPAAVQLHRI